MSEDEANIAGQTRRPVPRGLAREGPAVLSYGFRPFFFGAGLFAAIAMLAWIGALAGAWAVGGSSGPIGWHAHEMLFGYAAAALCGFVLTAVPNWTGRLPVSGRPLAVLAGLWLAGRVVMAISWLLGDQVTGVIDCLFLSVLAALVAREVVAGRNWKNLRVATGLSVLAALNIAFHLATVFGWDTLPVLRLTVGLYVMMISLVGGRIIPSFTRNWLARRGFKRFPRPVGRLDEVVLAATLLAALGWGLLGPAPATAAFAAVAAVLQAVRLSGWRGPATVGEPLLVVLHVGYAFVPIGLVALALAATGLIAEASALHVLTVGAVGLMTLAVMTRVTRGHTGRPLVASRMTTLSYVALGLAAISRPLAELVPEAYQLLLDVSGGAFILAFALFTIEHAPMLLAWPAEQARPARSEKRSA